MLDYKHNTKLTKDEKYAVEHYKDTGTTPIKWDYKFTRSELNQIRPDCLMINGYSRGTLDEKRLSKRDIERVNKLCNHLQSAIHRNPLNSTIKLMRGLSDPVWLIDNYYEGQSFFDEGFTSFTSNPAIALKYGLEYRLIDSKFVVFLDLTLQPNDFALYIDNIEDEYLLPRNSKYKIDTVVPIDMSNGYTALHYYISKENK